MFRFLRILTRVLDSLLLRHPGVNAEHGGVCGSQHRRVPMDANPRPIVAELKIPQAAIDAHNDQQDAQYKLEQLRLRIDWWRLGFEVGTFLLVLAGVILAMKNLIYLRHTLDATRRSADAAVKSAKVANDQLLVAQSAERAWIGVGNSALPVEWRDQNRIRVILPIVNGGPTIAKSVTLQARWFRREKSKPFAAGYPASSEIQTVGLLLPGAKRDLPIIMSADIQAMRRVQSGELIYYIFGRIRYVPVVEGSARQTTFCFQVYPDLTLGSEGACSDYNDGNQGQSEDQPQPSNAWPADLGHPPV